MEIYIHTLQFKNSYKQTKEWSKLKICQLVDWVSFKSNPLFLDLNYYSIEFQQHWMLCEIFFKSLVTTVVGNLQHFYFFLKDYGLHDVSLNLI